MASKPEASFIRSVHKYLPKDKLYTEGMANPYRGGTPDRYYEGNRSELWVEYKYYPILPLIMDLTNQKAKVKLSGLQMKWLRRAHGNGRRVAVIVGCPDGGIVIPGLTWERTYTREEAQALIWSRKEVMRWIADKCIKRS